MHIESPFHKKTTFAKAFDKSPKTPTERKKSGMNPEWLEPPALRETELFQKEAVEIEVARDLVHDVSPAMAKQLFAPKIETTDALSLASEIERLDLARNVISMYNKLDTLFFKRACQELAAFEIEKLSQIVASTNDKSILIVLTNTAKKIGSHFRYDVTLVLGMNGLLALPAEEMGDRLSLLLSLPGPDVGDRATTSKTYEILDDWEMNEVSFAKIRVSKWNAAAAQQFFPPPRKNMTDNDQLEIYSKAKSINYFLTWATEKLFERTFRMLTPEQAFAFILQANVGDKILYDDQLTLEGTPHFAAMVADYCRGIPISAYGMGDRVAKRGLAEREPQILEQEIKDYDDADFILHGLEKLRLPKESTPETVYAFCEAFQKGDRSACKAAIESVMGASRSKLQEKMFNAIFDNLDAWRNKISDPSDPNLASLHSRLPVSAQVINVWHAGFKKSRTIAPFEKILRKKMAGALFAMILDAVKIPTPFVAEDIVDKIGRLYDMALQRYEDVHRHGMPTLRALAVYLAKNAPAAGEFHVGRDTRTTTFIASNALRWGGMSAEERLQAIRYIDVSRPAFARTDKAILKQFLEQEKINGNMMGVDGGYHGSGPENILSTLKPDLSHDQLNEQIKLIGTHIVERRFSPDDALQEVVGWMERLPKFTERAQLMKRIEQDGFAKYFVVTAKRSEPERLLAWVVQHAVWREMIPKAVTSQKEKAGGK